MIALIITIIVMLILVGVTVTAAINGGIFEKAKIAETKYEQAKIDEKMEIGKAEDTINEYLTGKTVEESQDKNPGELEKENDTTYVINSIEDLVVFSNTVTTGEDNFEGKTVKLGCDLDFNSIKSYVEPYRTDYAKYGYDGELKELLTSGEGFKTIGVTTEDNSSKSFCGTFEGNGKTIYNLYINVVSTANEENRGLFASNSGTINNLNLLEVNLYLKYCPEDTTNKSGEIAGICAQNAKKGVVSNCKVSGKIELNTSTKNSAVGGIAGHSRGYIKNCVNIAQIIFKNYENAERIEAGGICCSTYSSIENCYNIGEVFAFAKEGKAIVGGIVGFIDSSAIIKNCYNTGKISGEAKLLLRVGGICGNLGKRYYHKFL